MFRDLNDLESLSLYPIQYIIEKERIDVYKKELDEIKNIFYSIEKNILLEITIKDQYDTLNQIQTIWKDINIKTITLTHLFLLRTLHNKLYNFEYKNYTKYIKKITDFRCKLLFDICNYKIRL